MKEKTRELICQDCGERFRIEVSGKKKYKRRLCDDCWKKKRTGPLSDEHKAKCAPGNCEGQSWIDTKAHISIGNKEVVKMIRRRNKEIDKLNEIIDSLTKENIRLKDELTCSCYTGKVSK